MPAMVVRFRVFAEKFFHLVQRFVAQGSCYGCRNSDSSPKCKGSQGGLSYSGCSGPKQVGKKTETEKALAKNSRSRWSNHGGSCKRTIEWGQCNFGNLPTSPPPEAGKIYIFLFFLSKHRIRLKLKSCSFRIQHLSKYPNCLQCT